MKVTLGTVYDKARAPLQGGDVDASSGFSNTQMEQFFAVAYPELWQIMGQVQTPRVRRDFFHYLPAYTTYFDPQAIGITDFGEPEWMEERGDVTTMTITSTSNTSPIVVTVASTASISDSTQIQIADVAGTNAPWGMWYPTIINGTTLSLNGSTAPGTVGTGGKLMQSTNRFIQMQPVRDMPFNAAVTNRLGVWQWQDNALKFLGANQPVQIHITYWASAVPPTNVNTELGIDDCLAFLSTRVASLAARARGWYSMATELKTDALGPSMQPDGSGGLLRAWLNLQVINMQRTEFRKRPERTNNAWNYPGDYIYGFISGGGSGSGGTVVPENPCGGYYVVPVVSNVAYPDLSLGRVQEITATSDTLVSTPLQLQPGPFWIRLIQGGSGNYNWSFSSIFYNILPAYFSGVYADVGTVTQLSLVVEDDLRISYLGITYGPV
jgi:hypothetical protein